MRSLQPDFRIPPLFCPFEAKLHPKAMDAEPGFFAWLERLGADLDAGTLAMLRDSHAAKICGFIVPEGETERLQWFTNWFYWLWLFDPVADQEPAVGHTAGYARWVGGLARLLSTPHRPPQTDPVAQVGSACMADFERNATPLQVQRIQQAARDMHLFTIHQVAVGDQGRLPGVDEYLSHRMYASALPAAMAPVEVVHGEEIPARAMALPWTQAMTEMTSLLVSIDNDFLSYPLERTTMDNQQNLINVIAHQNGIPLARALDEAVELRDQIMLRYLRLAKTPPPGGGAPLRRFVAALHNFVAGNIPWETTAPRYAQHFPGGEVSVEITHTTAVRERPLPYPSIAWWWRL
ncbi:terpene synthase family protein [Streptomyces sp. NPDC021100]|uniref:terpene synthase family protein n=1 Tax=Streptomyces sp. NPDC021100 TaxID=3365114 RepID=UPI0037A205AD